MGIVQQVRAINKIGNEQNVQVCIAVKCTSDVSDYLKSGKTYHILTHASTMSYTIRADDLDNAVTDFVQNQDKFEIVWVSIPVSIDGFDNTQEKYVVASTASVDGLFAVDIDISELPSPRNVGDKVMWRDQKVASEKEYPIMTREIYGMVVEMLKYPRKVNGLKVDCFVRCPNGETILTDSGELVKVEKPVVISAVDEDESHSLKQIEIGSKIIVVGLKSDLVYPANSKLELAMDTATQLTVQKLLRFDNDKWMAGEYATAKHLNAKIMVKIDGEEIAIHPANVMTV